MSTPSVWVIDVTADTFEQDVILRSKTRPVVVDFWAEWCGPCRALGPVLERLAAEYEGKFGLAKINIDEEQALASSFGVQSIPLVVAFRDGKAANHFLGVLPEEEVKAFVDGLMPTEADHLTEQAAALAASDPAQAETLYRQALGENGPVAARLGLARLLAERGETAEIESREWSGTQAIARELALLPDGTLGMEPAREWRAARRGHLRHPSLLVPAWERVPIPEWGGSCFECTFRNDGAHPFALILAANSRAQGTEIRYDPENRTIGGAYVGEGPMEVRVFVDHTTIELFANGRACVTRRTYNRAEDDRAFVVAGPKPVTLDWRHSWRPPECDLTFRIDAV